MTLFRAIVILTALVLGSATASAAAKAAGPSIVFDPATGAVLSADRAGEPWYPASLTKLMTAYVVFHKMRAGTLTLKQQLEVSELASSQPPSKIGMKPGTKVSADFALQSLLVYSANDMAYVLAEGASGTVAAFVGEMNAAARKLGMTGTNYINPNGLFEPRQISTARDIAILASALLREFPEHAHYFSQAHLVVGKRKLPNRNSLIRQMPEADGMKTGFVCNSGFNLVATASREGYRLGAVVLGASSGKHRADLAEMLLVDGFVRGAPATSRSLQQVDNMAQGAIVPADLTGNVCRTKTRVEPVPSSALTGWGISFGAFDTAIKADMALRGRILGPAGRTLTAPAGVIRMPGGTSYAAVLWNMTQGASLAACAAYRRELAPCDVLTPELFAEITALTPDPPPAKALSTTQGSDSSKAKKKKKSN